MIPLEVYDIAQVLAAEYKGSKGDWENFIDIAWKIYNEVVYPIVKNYEKLKG